LAQVPGKCPARLPQDGDALPLVVMKLASPFLAAIVALLAGLVMPHTRNPDKVALRRERAIARGYVKPAPSGRVHIEVPAACASPLKTMVKAAVLHRSLDQRTSVAHHHLAHAALAARPLLTEGQFKHAICLNKRAGAAKHRISSWADPWDTDSGDAEDDVPLAACDGVAAAPASDPWFSGLDPWSRPRDDHLAARSGSLGTSPSLPSGGADAALEDAPECGRETRSSSCTPPALPVALDADVKDLLPSSQPWLGDQPRAVRVTASCGPPSLPMWQGSGVDLLRSASLQDAPPVEKCCSRPRVHWDNGGGVTRFFLDDDESSSVSGGEDLPLADSAPGFAMGGEGSLEPSASPGPLARPAPSGGIAPQADSSLDPAAAEFVPSGPSGANSLPFGGAPLAALELLQVQNSTIASLCSLLASPPCTYAAPDPRLEELSAEIGALKDQMAALRSAQADAHRRLCALAGSLTSCTQKLVGNVAAELRPELVRAIVAAQQDHTDESRKCIHGAIDRLAATLSARQSKKASPRSSLVKDPGLDEFWTMAARTRSRLPHLVEAPRAAAPILALCDRRPLGGDSSTVDNLVFNEMGTSSSTSSSRTLKSPTISAADLLRRSSAVAQEAMDRVLMRASAAGR